MFKNSLFSVFAIALVVPCVPAGAVTVINGTFDDNASAYVVWPGYNNGGTNPANPTGWTFSGGSGINPVFPDGPNQAPFNDGANTGPFAFLQGESRMEQSIGGFTVGGDYTLNLSFNARNCCGPVGQPAPTPIAEVYLNGVLLASSAALFPAPGGVIPGSVANGGNWYSAGIPFTAAADTLLLSIRARPAAGGDTTLIVDNVSIVPEPAMASLLACGMLSALARRRRQTP